MGVASAATAALRARRSQARLPSRARRSMPPAAGGRGGIGIAFLRRIEQRLLLFARSLLHAS